MLKGQVEYAILLGLFILIVVVIYFAIVLMGVGEPPIPGDARHVKNSFENLVIRGANVGIRELESRGGYFFPEQGYELFLQKPVAYWQKCDQTYIPPLNDIEDKLARYIGLFIWNNINTTDIYYGKNVTFDLDKMKVKTNIHDNKVDVVVSLPTKVNDFRMLKYEIRDTIHTKFGEIYKFAKDYVEDNKKYRHIDIFTITALYFSRDLPTFGYLTDCGETIYLTPDFIGESLEEIVVYVLRNTYFWQELENKEDEPRIFTITEINDKQYRHLDPKFKVPDNFNIKGFNTVLIKNNDYISSYPFAPIPECLRAYNIRYSFNFPYIIRVKDNLNNATFNFAVLAAVDDNARDGCEDIPVAGEKCDESNCSAKLMLINTDNEPVENANVFFGNCGLGSTDSLGFAEGNVKCGNQELFIFSEGYGMIKKTIRSELLNSTFVLRRTPNITVTLSQKYVHNCSEKAKHEYATIQFVSNDYSYSFVNVVSDNPNETLECMKEICPNLDDSVCLYNNRDGIIACSIGVNSVRGITLNHVPEGRYNLTADIFSAENNIKGNFESSIDIPNNNSKLKITIPVSVLGITNNLAEPLRNNCGVEVYEWV